MLGLSCLGMIFQQLIGENVYSDFSWSIFWRLGSTFLYILFIKRLQLTFKDTLYPMKNTKALIVFYIGCFVFVLLDIIGYVVYYSYSTDSISEHTLSIWWSAIVTIAQIIDLMLSSYSIALFVRRIWMLTIDIGDNIDKQSVHSINDGQLIIIKAVSKITILSSIAIISSQIFLLFEASLFGLRYKNGYTDEVSLGYDIWWMYLPIDCIINALSIYLSFDFNDGCYKKMCFCLDGCCVYTNKRKFTALKTRLLSNEFSEL